MEAKTPGPSTPGPRAERPPVCALSFLSCHSPQSQLITSNGNSGHVILLLKTLQALSTVLGIQRELLTYTKTSHILYDPAATLTALLHWASLRVLARVPARGSLTGILSRRLTLPHHTLPSGAPRPREAHKASTTYGSHTRLSGHPPALWPMSSKKQGNPSLLFTTLAPRCIPELFGEYSVPLRGLGSCPRTE